MSNFSFSEDFAWWVNSSSFWHRHCKHLTEDDTAHSYFVSLSSIFYQAHKSYHFIPLSGYICRILYAAYSMHCPCKTWSARSVRRLRSSGNSKASEFFQLSSTAEPAISDASAAMKNKKCNFIFSKFWIGINSAKKLKILFKIIWKELNRNKKSIMHCYVVNFKTSITPLQQLCWKFMALALCNNVSYMQHFLESLGFANWVQSVYNIIVVYYYFT